MKRFIRGMLLEDYLHGKAGQIVTIDLRKSAGLETLNYGECDGRDCDAVLHWSPVPESRAFAYRFALDPVIPVRK